jgi:DNA polymerase III epsilon subunit-like protein
MEEKNVLLFLVEKSQACIHILTKPSLICSGIRPEDLEGAPSFESVRDKVESLLAGKLLVGHALHHDLEVPVL